MKDSVRKFLKLPVKNPVEYWDKYWDYFTGKLSKKDNYEVTVDSPRFLIDNIISEIEYNNLKNKNNSRLFKAQLGEWNKKDFVFNKLFHNKVVLLLQNWDESRDQYILSICKEINTELNKGTYFDDLVEHLTNIISTAKSLDYNTKKEINKYTDLIISEFIANGFIIDDIKSLQHDISDVIIDASGTVIAAPDKYKKLERKDYENEDLYYKAIKNYIENRTIEERISILKDYYHIEPRDCFVLFRLKGIKGDIDCMIDDVNIYAPHLKKYIKDTPSLSRIEQTTPERKYINASIPVQHKSLYSSVAYAKQKLERIIDLLSLSYNTSAPIEWNPNDISIIENGVFICGLNPNIIDENKSSEHQKFATYMESLDVSDIVEDIIKISERFVAINKNQTSNTLKLATAAHWYQKGKNTQNPEDKLLFHWIAVESLLKTNSTMRCNIVGHKEANILHTIQKIAASIIVKNFFYSHCFDTYIDINYKTHFYDNYLDIPADIIEKASLNMTAGIKFVLVSFFIT